GPSGSQAQTRAHDGGVQTLSLSGDGQLLLTGGPDETLRLWEPGKLRELRRIEGDVGPVEQVCLAPGGKWAASCSLRLMRQDMVVQRWDLASGSQRRRLRGPTDTIRCVAVAPDGKRVAAGGDDRTVWLWSLDPPGGQGLCLKGHTDAVTGVVF